MEKKKFWNVCDAEGAPYNGVRFDTMKEAESFANWFFDLDPTVTLYIMEAVMIIAPKPAPRQVIILEDLDEKPQPMHGFAAVQTDDGCRRTTH